VGPRAGLDTEARGKLLCLCRGSNLDRPVVQPVVRHYTDSAAPGQAVYQNTVRRMQHTTGVRRVSVDTFMSRSILFTSCISFKFLTRVNPVHNKRKKFPTCRFRQDKSVTFFPNATEYGNQIYFQVFLCAGSPRRQHVTNMTKKTR
jgi:hypothetical protein